MSLGGILSIARSALIAQQGAMQVASHNIANAQTEGYTAQRANLVAAPSLTTAAGTVGTGVLLQGVTHSRDLFLDASYREEAAEAAGWATREDLLGRVETIFGEPSDNGLASAMDAFFSAWSDVASRPASASARAVVIERGAQLAAEFRQRSAALQQLGADIQTRLENSIDRLNTLAAQVADLNHRIVALESDGTTASDLRDARDRALDEMSTIVPLQIVERGDGSIAANVNGFTLVEGSGAARFEVDSTAGAFSIKTASGSTVTGVGGAVGAMLDTLNVDLVGARSQLDTLAASLADAVNTQHRNGVSLSQKTGLDFFASGGAAAIDASNITISPDITGPDDVAAGTGDTSTTPPTYLAGNNNVALALSQLRDLAQPALSGKSFGDYYTDTVSDVGLAVAAARDAAEVHQTLAEQADNRRAAVSGVSTDEELTRLIQAQSAYAAAARVVTAANEMIQSVLDMVR
ncbi:MAG: flagellar hook-associated protein FlgK [Gemmatimonadetes bacterium]|nr:flagellar hook-associated protein FlgK [Gemmatimonadota bacterium]